MSFTTYTKNITKLNNIQRIAQKYSLGVHRELPNNPHATRTITAHYPAYRPAPSPYHPVNVCIHTPDTASS